MEAVQALILQIIPVKSRRHERPGAFCRSATQRLWYQVVVQEHARIKPLQVIIPRYHWTVTIVFCDDERHAQWDIRVGLGLDIQWRQQTAERHGVQQAILRRVTAPVALQFPKQLSTVGSARTIGI